MKRFVVTMATVAVLGVACTVIAKPVPTWERQINTPGRFKVLGAFGGAAVVDKETGLVWEQDATGSSSTWTGAFSVCAFKTVGGRAGWRLPTAEELQALVDTGNTNPALPTGHPFAVNLDLYWTATTDATGTTLARLVNFGNGDLGSSGTKTVTVHDVWCVRGGQGVQVFP